MEDPIDPKVRDRQQRERNREAVRNCRKRKKEQENALRERIEDLERLNKKLKQELYEGVKTEKTGINEGKDLISSAQNVEELVRNMSNTMQSRPAKTESKHDNHLKRDLNLYLQRHQDHGRDRQKAIGFILHGIKRLVEPERITKMLIYQMTQEDPTFYTAENGMWKEMCTELNLSAAQEAYLRSRRVHCERLRTELDYACAKVVSIWELAKKNKKEADSLAHIKKVLQPHQLASFICWVHNEPSCKDILNSLWDELLHSCDAQINADRLKSENHRLFCRRLQQSSCRLVASLLETNDPQERRRIARLCFHPNVVMEDPNTKTFHGLGGIERYLLMLDHAFKGRHNDGSSGKRILGMKVEERRLNHDDQDNDKVTSAWVITGTYTGRLVQSPLLSPDSPSNAVSINAVADFTFGDASSPELVTELVVSWNALALMNQLGIIKTEKQLPELSEIEPIVLDTDKTKKPVVSTKSKPERVETNPLQSTDTACLYLSKVFDAPRGDIRRHAQKIIHASCELKDVFIGREWKGIEECIAYIERLRRVFPTLKISSEICSRIPIGGDVSRIEMKWKASAKYNGKLGVVNNNECKFDGNVFVECCPRTNKIVQITLNIVAQDLLYQIGILS